MIGFYQTNEDHMEDSRAIHKSEYVEKRYWIIRNMIFHMISPKKGPRSVLLEIGCGSGSDSKMVVEGFDKYIGIDVDEKMIKIAKEKNPDEKYEFHRADATDANEMKIFPDNSIDAIVMIYVLEHISEPEQLFFEVSRTLKRGGIVCILAPNLLCGAGLIIRILPESIKKKLKRRITGVSEEYTTYYKANTIKKIDQLADKVGLTRKEMVMFSFIGYFYKYPGFLYWHLFWSKIFSWKPLRRYKTLITASYQKY